MKKVQALRGEMRRSATEMEASEREADLRRSAELKYGVLPELEKKLRDEEERLSNRQQGSQLLREMVTEEEIADIVSRWTGIPVTRLVEGEREKLLNSMKCCTGA